MPEAADLRLTLVFEQPLASSCSGILSWSLRVVLMCSHV